jgi:hypothetical protein
MLGIQFWKTLDFKSYLTVILGADRWLISEMLLKSDKMDLTYVNMKTDLIGLKRTFFYMLEK